MSRERDRETGPTGGVEDVLAEALRDHGLFAWLDLSVETVEPGRVAFRLPFDEKFANIASGTVHGGITATVIDTASGFALRSTFDDPRSGRLATTDLNVRYVRPVTDDLRVEAEVIRAGGRTGVTEAEATVDRDGERTVVATGGTTYRLFRDGDGGDGGGEGGDAAANDDSGDRDGDAGPHTGTEVPDA